MEHYTLSNGVQIPKIGFGTWQLEEGKQAYDAVLYALKTGYRHIDTAQLYGNEISVGKAIKDSGLPRKDIFLTTKVWNDCLDYDSTYQSVLTSMDKLGVDYLDLVLIHWPNPKPIRLQDPEGYKTRNAQVWAALEDLYQAGKLRAIGVSNFMPHHLTALLDTARIKPQVNQLLLAPGSPQTDLVALCRQQDILLEAYSPFGTGTLFGNPVLGEMAERYGKTPGQIALAWSLQNDFLPLPKSATPQNIASNLDCFDIKLTDQDMTILTNLQGSKVQSDPDNKDY